MRIIVLMRTFLGVTTATIFELAMRDRLVFSIRFVHAVD